LFDCHSSAIGNLKSPLSPIFRKRIPKAVTPLQGSVITTDLALSSVILNGKEQGLPFNFKEFPQI